MLLCMYTVNWRATDDFRGSGWYERKSGRGLVGGNPWWRASDSERFDAEHNRRWGRDHGADRHRGAVLQAEPTLPGSADGAVGALPRALSLGVRGRPHAVRARRVLSAAVPRSRAARGHRHRTRGHGDAWEATGRAREQWRASR